jgi:hypothetical protein
MQGAIAVIGYNRPHYFKQAFDSLMQNIEMTTMPVYFCIDGGGGKEKEYIELINKYESSLPYTVEWQTITRLSNLGVAHHLFTVREKILIKDGFDYVIVVEDDVLCSPYLLTVTINLLKWTENNYKNVPVVSAWRWNFMSDELKKQHLNSVIATNDHWITYAMTKWGWNIIRPYVKEYLDRFVTAGKYKERNHVKIREWIRDLPYKNRTVFPPFPSTVELNLDSDVFPTSQDGAIAAAMYKENLVKVNTMVNRCLYIGEEGEHGTKEIFRKKRFNEMSLGIYKDDPTIREFVPFEKNAVWKEHKIYNAQGEEI